MGNPMHPTFVSLPYLGYPARFDGWVATYCNCLPFLAWLNFVTIYSNRWLVQGGIGISKGIRVLNNIGLTSPVPKSKEVTYGVSPWVGKTTFSLSYLTGMFPRISFQGYPRISLSILRKENENNTHLSHLRVLIFKNFSNHGGQIE